MDTCHRGAKTVKALVGSQKTLKVVADALQLEQGAKNLDICH